MRSLLITAIMCAGIGFGVNSANAISGGPFSGGAALETGIDGTYQMTMTGPNLVGTATIQVSRSFGSYGRYSVFNGGLVSMGSAQASVDPTVGSIAGVLSDIFYTSVFNGDLELTAPIDVDATTGRITGDVLRLPAGSGRFLAAGKFNSAAFNFIGSGTFTSIEYAPGQRRNGTLAYVQNVLSSTNFTVYGFRSSTLTELNSLFNDPLTNQPLP